uniref:Uncharacterized protein n=1 Tax=Vespula pensylvanica TaxID=30213 RepID=A0A834UEQ6_VESPE|nr:hypothetical protein H0235_003470 [Vespula pensylvanica]
MRVVIPIVEFDIENVTRRNRYEKDFENESSSSLLCFRYDKELNTVGIAESHFTKEYIFCKAGRKARPSVQPLWSGRYERTKGKFKGESTIGPDAFSGRMVWAKNLRTKYESPHVDWRLEIIAIRISLFIHGSQTDLLGRFGGRILSKFECRWFPFWEGTSDDRVLSSASSLLDRMGFHHGWIRITIVSTVPRWSYHRPSTHSAVWNGDDNDDADATVSLITGRSTRGEMPPIIGATPLKQSNRTRTLKDNDINRDDESGNWVLCKRVTCPVILNSQSYPDRLVALRSKADSKRS